jgi:hypothetical protein
MIQFIFLILLFLLITIVNCSQLVAVLRNHIIYEEIDLFHFNPTTQQVKEFGPLFYSSSVGQFGPFSPLNSTHFAVVNATSLSQTCLEIRSLYKQKKTAEYCVINQNQAVPSYAGYNAQQKTVYFFGKHRVFVFFENCFAELFFILCFSHFSILLLCFYIKIADYYSTSHGIYSWNLQNNAVKLVVSILTSTFFSAHYCQSRNIFFLFLLSCSPNCGNIAIFDTNTLKLSYAQIDNLDAITYDDASGELYGWVGATKSLDVVHIDIAQNTTTVLHSLPDTDTIAGRITRIYDNRLFAVVSPVGNLQWFEMELTPPYNTRLSKLAHNYLSLMHF